MKIEKYIVEIEMPEGDGVSSLWVEDVLQTDADVEDEGRWKVTVKEYWRPTEEQMEALKEACREHYDPKGALYSLCEDLVAL